MTQVSQPTVASRHGGYSPATGRCEMATHEDNFWAKVRKGPGCWEWTAALRDTGYGQMGLSKSSPFFGYANGTGPWNRPIKAHRFSWLIHHGSIPEGMCVLHHCDNRKCVRPDHLFLGTKTDNMRDASAKGRLSGQKTTRTHCKRGHPFTGSNAVVWSGRRRCRACNQAWRRERGT